MEKRVSWSSVFTIDAALFKEDQFHAKPRNESTEAFLNFLAVDFFFNMIGRIITVCHYPFRNGQAYVFSIT